MKKVKIAMIIGLLVMMVAMILSWATNKSPKKSAPTSGPSQVQARKMTFLECLARNLAWETLQNSHKRPEGRAELEAIVHVVLQRKKLGKKAGYQNTICGVIYQRAQFSWTLKRSLRFANPKDLARWKYMQRVAADGLAGRFLYPWPANYEWIVSYKQADNKSGGKKPAIWIRVR